MTSVKSKREAAWMRLRAADFGPVARDIIAATVPAGLTVGAVTHIRSAHYGAYRVDDTAGGGWIVRIGTTIGEAVAVDNSGYLGTSAVTPSGQRREYELAQGFAASGGMVCVPRHYAETADGYDVLWLPFLQDVGQPVNAGRWYETLTSLQAYRPDRELPVFTNRAKSFARLDSLSSAVAEELGKRYDEQLERLFSLATQWSVVHGDAHGENVINTGERAVLFDFDTACWAPSVWDLTHLLTRAGTGPDTGFAAGELRGLFNFTDEEIDAAVALRRTAARIAVLHRAV